KDDDVLFSLIFTAHLMPPRRQKARNSTLTLQPDTKSICQYLFIVLRRSSRPCVNRPLFASRPCDDMRPSPQQSIYHPVSSGQSRDLAIGGRGIYVPGDEGMMRHNEGKLRV